MKQFTHSLSMITLSFLLIAAMFSCGGKNSADKSADAYQETKESLEEIEKKNPVRFLSVSGSDKKNILGQTVIKGKLRSKASVVSYKDVDIKLSFFSKTGALLEEDREVIYETVAPGAEVSFKSKYFAPKGSDSVGFKIMSAKY